LRVIDPNFRVSGATAAETDNGLQPATIVGMVGASDRYACGVLIAQIQRALGS
jgi:hypothetical protein